MAKNALTPKQEQFVAEFMRDFNGSAAYVRAGYKAANERVARTCAAQLLAKPSVSAAVAKARARHIARIDMNAAAVVSELSLIGSSDIGDIMDFSNGVLRLKEPSQIPEHARRAISSVKVKRYFEGKGEEAREVEITEFKLWPKNDALKTLAQVHGILKNGQGDGGTEGVNELVALVRELRAAMERRRGDGSRTPLAIVGESSPIG